jgi:hypothetical protein
MQGGTVEQAIVVGSPRDLSAGWSYTALSRARGHTSLLVHDDHPDRDRDDLAPAQRRRAADRRELLARVERRMRERDDEDLALEQLPPAGAADDPQLTLAFDHAHEPAQEHAAARAEPVPLPVSIERLCANHARLDALRAQHAALPLRALRNLEHLDTQARETSALRDELTRELAALPEPTRRLGCTRDEHAAQRASLSAAIDGHDRQHDELLNRRTRLGRELGDPEQIRSERDGLDRAISNTEREQTQLRAELAERELHAPSEWVQRTLGERPADPHQRSAWDDGARTPARYRLDHQITDPASPLGPEPERGGQDQRDWQRADDAIARTARQLGRDHHVNRDRGLDLGR